VVGAQALAEFSKWGIAGDFLPLMISRVRIVTAGGYSSGEGAVFRWYFTMLIGGLIGAERVPGRNFCARGKDAENSFRSSTENLGCIPFDLVTPGEMFPREVEGSFRAINARAERVPEAS